MDKREQEIFYKNLNETSFYFFAVIGLIHILTGLIEANGLFIKPTWLVNRLFDIPFLIVTLLYLGSYGKLELMKKGNYSKLADIYFGVFGGMIVGIIFIVDLIFNNKLPL